MVWVSEKPALQNRFKGKEPSLLHNAASAEQIGCVYLDVSRIMNMQSSVFMSESLMWWHMLSYTCYYEAHFIFMPIQ